jgi:phage gpG-like protein
VDLAVNLDIRLDGTTVVRDLTQTASRLTNLRPAFESIVDDFLNLEEQGWETEGAVVGRHWKPLSKKWAAWKAKNRPGAGILEMTAGGGPLRKSLTVRGAPYQRLDVGDDTLVMGTRHGIAKIHQTGRTVTLRSGKSSKTHKATIPARPIVRVQAATRRRWVATIDGFVHHGGTSAPRRLVNL